ncbi:MAG TPA: HAMP domain-containing sensor histidine kinase [Myxococcus sp.]|nr:HAMP domain-containing sensor histidine kinase [Myxococcus sp.]
MDDARQQQLWRRAKRLPRAVVVVVLPLASAVLAGWALRGHDVLARALPGLPTMTLTTASCLVLSAAALGWRLATDSPRRRGWAWGFAAVVTMLGGLTLASYIWREDGMLGLGRLPGGLMSPQTAVSFFLLGLSLLAVEFRGRSSLSQALALAALLAPLMALMGYALGEHRIYRIGARPGIAPHTAVSLMLLALGALLLRPERSWVSALMSQAAGGIMARRLLFSGLLPVVVGLLVDVCVRAGLIEARLAWPLFAVTMMVVLTAVVWRAAVALNRMHEAQEQARRQASLEAERQRNLAAENARLYREAEAAAREREDVLAIVSHDLKNPLATLRLSAAVLQQKLSKLPQGEALVKRVGTMDRAALQMLSLITGLLDAARLDAGQPLAVAPQPEAVDALVTEAVALIEPQATRRALRLEARLAPDLEALCDRERVLQVLANLLGNAVKFTPEGGTVVVSTRLEAGEVHLSVRDTGPGIPLEEQPFLFQRHWQSRNTAHHGSGLGLYIARGLVEAHGGRLWVESTPGAGTTFTFTLPLAPRRQPSHPALDSSGAEV